MRFKAFGPKTAPKLIEKIKSLEADTKKELKKAVTEAVLMVHSDMVKSVADNSDGGKEIRYQPKRMVAVSNPGNPPNSDTGQLIKSMQFNVNEESLEGTVNVKAPYGGFLEFGTSKMAARPYFRPAIQKNKERILKAIRLALEAGLKSAKKG